MELVFVIAIFENGVHKGYWDDEVNDLKVNLSCATIHDRKQTLEDSLGEIPRKYDARIFSLQPAQVTMYTLHIRVDSLPMSVVCAGNLDNIKDFISNYQSVPNVKFILLTWSGGDIEEQWDGDKKSLIEYLEEL